MAAEWLAAGPGRTWCMPLSVGRGLGASRCYGQLSRLGRLGSSPGPGPGVQHFTGLSGSVHIMIVTMCTPKRGKKWPASAPGRTGGNVQVRRSSNQILSAADSPGQMHGTSLTLLQQVQDTAKKVDAQIYAALTG